MLFYSIWHPRQKLLLAAPSNTSFMLQYLTCSITSPYQHREMKIQTATYETHSDINKHCILTTYSITHFIQEISCFCFIRKDIERYNYEVLSVDIWHHIYKIQ
jgi:hypothetical protein